MHIEILICTLNNRINKITERLLPPLPNISYLISLQHTFPLSELNISSELLQREDIKLIKTNSIGLSFNRNYALSHATGDILLISDDDVCYIPQQLEKIREVFQYNTQIDVACFKVQDDDGNDLKSYPSQSFTYNKIPKGMYFSSVEIALRKSTLKTRFDERFGLNAPVLACGEEEIFLFDIFKAGGTITYFPIVIAKTAHTLSMTKFIENPKIRMTKGAVLYHFYGLFGALLRISKYAFLRKKDINPWYSFKDMLEGIKYMLLTLPKE